MKIRIIAVLMFLVLSLEAGAQSLPEVARHERERRRGSAVGRVFTNENVGSGRSTAPVRPPAVPAAELDPGEPLPVAEGVEVRGEQQWRALFSGAREEVMRARNRLLLTEQELVELNRRLLTESSLYNREYQLLPEIQAKQEELTAAQARVEEANQALRDLEQSLRRAGAPPGWGRP